MHLLISDVHLGKGTVAEEREKERALIDCINHFKPRIESLILLGDIFEHYIEYRNLVPKGYSRFLGTLADLCDSNIPITYFVGNNDPWHQNFFNAEFNATVVMDDLIMDLSGVNTYLTHGDGMGARRSKYSILKPILRNRFPVFLYRTFLPGDMGIRLAKFAKKTLTNDRIDWSTVEQLRHYANETLRQDDITHVVMGHTHYPEVVETEHGKYINTGSWHHNRTFGIADNRGIRLMHWTNGESCEYNDRA